MRTIDFSPLYRSVVGFDRLAQLLETATVDQASGYPPYNIERVVEQGSNGSSGKERLRITIAVAGFTVHDLEVTLEDRQLVIRGKQKEEEQKDYLHRGIAARQFSRAFVLADGMEIGEARLQNGLLTIEVHRIEPERLVRRINVKDLN